MTKNKRVTITINNDLDLHFRKLASSKMLFETGWYSKAVEEAMELWIENESSFKFFIFFYFFLIRLAVAKIYGSKLNDLQIGNKIVTA